MTRWLEPDEDGVWCDDECPEDCTTDHQGEQ